MASSELRQRRGLPQQSQPLHPNEQPHHPHQTTATQIPSPSRHLFPLNRAFLPTALRNRPFLREVLCSALYVSASTSVFLICHTQSLQRLILALTSSLPLPPTLLPDSSPTALFLGAIAGLIAFWDYHGLALGSPLNPALTIAFALASTPTIPSTPTITPRRHLRKTLCGQFLGHALAIHLVRLFASDHLVTNLRLLAPPRPTTTMPFATAAIFEASMTAVAASAALSVKRLVRGPFVQSLIMLSVAVTIIAAGQTRTGSLINPAMILALAIAEPARDWTVPDHAIYWLGPFSGALLVGSLFRFFWPQTQQHQPSETLPAENTFETGPPLTTTSTSTSVISQCPSIAAPQATDLKHETSDTLIGDTTSKDNVDDDNNNNKNDDINTSISN